MKGIVQEHNLKQSHKVNQKWPMKLMSQISDFSWIFTILHYLIYTFELSKLQNISRQKGGCYGKNYTIAPK